MPQAWRKAVYANADLPQGSVDRDAYVVCVLEQLHRALDNRNVFASPSHRWSDPRARLLDGAAWDAVCEEVLAGLSLDMPVTEHLAELGRALDAGWKQMAERLESAGKDAGSFSVVLARSRGGREGSCRGRGSACYGPRPRHELSVPKWRSGLRRAAPSPGPGGRSGPRRRRLPPARRGPR